MGRVAVLWVERKSPYWRLWPTVELWGRGRDANTYHGPFPIIAHPPCGPWGKYKTVSQESRSDGIQAMSHVHQWGGIVEQPLGSELFALHGGPGRIAKVNQGDFGHLALKPTLLYIVSPK